MDSRPMIPNASGEQRGFAAPQPSLDFFRNEINGCDRFVCAVFREQVVAGNFIMNPCAELVGRAIRGNFLQLHPGTQRSRRVLPHTPKLAPDRLLQFFRQFDAFSPDEDVHRFLFPRTDLDFPCCPAAWQSSDVCVLFHRLVMEQRVDPGSRCICFSSWPRAIGVLSKSRGEFGEVGRETTTLPAVFVPMPVVFVSIATRRPALSPIRSRCGRVSCN